MMPCCPENQAQIALSASDVGVRSLKDDRVEGRVKVNKRSSDEGQNGLRVIDKETEINN